VTKTLGAVLNLKLVYVLVEKSAIPASADALHRRHPRLLLDSGPLRRVGPHNAVYLAGLGATHQPSEVDSYDVARAFVDEIPREAFWL
jgi:hypothetical protein